MSDILKNLNLDNLSLSEQVKLLSSIEKALVNNKVRQKDLVKTNTDLVLQSLKKIRNDIEDKFNLFEQSFNDKAAKIEGRPGKDGRNGKDGPPGPTGLDGKNGKDGRDGRDGVDGKDGVSVTDAKIDFDGSLVITLSTGKEINVGEVVSSNLAEQIRHVTTMSTNNGGGGISSVASADGSVTVTTTSGAVDLSVAPRSASATTATSLTPDISAKDLYAYTALASGLTINAPIGTPVNGNKLLFRFLDNGTSRSLTWNATYTAIGVTLPTSTTASKTTYVGCIYNADNTRWDAIAVTTQA
jgi:hypothetical protein